MNTLFKRRASIRIVLILLIPIVVISTLISPQIPGIPSAYAAVGMDKIFTDILSARPNMEYRSNNYVIDTETSVSVSGGTQSTIVKNLSNTDLTSVSGLV